MRTSPRTPSLAFAALCVASLAACGEREAPVQRCQTESECPSGARCLSQICVANSSPTAAFSVPGGPLEANALLTFDGSASFDPDAPEDSVASYEWSFASVGAPCDPPTVASAAREARVRFACPGTFSVTLVVRDRMARASAPLTRQVAVAAYSGTALVEVGADVTTAHRCTPDPARCTLESGSIQLSAAPTEAGAAASTSALTYRWSVEPPPDRPIDATRTVSLSPSTDVADPVATIETAGTAISGDWIFRVEARDEAGVIATLAARVSVTNSPPVVAATVPPSFPHGFSATTSQFTSTGAILFQVSDPDGDALVDRSLTWRHAGDGGALFEGQDLGDRATFNVIVPYSDVSDALHLRGGADLARSIDVSIADVNGAVTQASWPIVVGNQAPQRTYATPATPVNHSFDLAAVRYRADVVVGTWTDADGDPLVQWGTTGDAQCAAAEVVAGQGTVHCELAYPGNPAAHLFAGTHSVTVALGDPWGPANPAVPVSFTIANRAPVVTNVYAAAGGRCTRGTCCQDDPETGDCIGYDWDYAGGSGTAPPGASDPDGDPLVIDAAGRGSYVALSPADLVPITARVDADSGCGSVSSSTTVGVTAGDGVASAAGSVIVQGGCN